MMEIIGKLICAIALLSHTFVSFGQTLQIVNIDIDPKTVAMGFVDIVSDNVESAVFANSAAMSFSDFKVAVTGSYCYWQPDVFKEHRASLSGSYKINGRWALAAGLVNGAGTSYNLYGNDAEFMGKFTPMNLHFKVGASYEIFPYISIGMNIGFADNIMAPQHANMALLSDLFVMSSVADFKVAVGARNIGVAWTNNGTVIGNLPFIASAGASYGVSFHDNHDMGINIQYDFTGTDAMSTSIGASYSYRNCFAVRAGGRIGYGKVQSLATIGCGFMLDFLEINMAYVLPIQHIALSDTISVSVVYIIK